MTHAGRIGRVGDSPKRNKQAIEREAKMARFIALTYEGYTTAKALVAVPLESATYQAWRQRYPEFKREVDEARLLAHDPHQGGLAFRTFRKVFFGYDTALHHHDMAMAMDGAEADSITMILAAPESAKTQLVVDRITYRLAVRNPDERIAVISAGQDLARKILQQVTNRMTDDTQFEPFIRTYGPFRAPDRTMPKPWNADYFQVIKASNDFKEPSMEARGAGSKLYGGRYEWIVIDDIQDSESLNQTPGLLRYIRQTVLTRPVAGEGRTTVVGSRVGTGDIYETMLDEGMVDKLLTIPALTRWVDKDEHYEKRTERGKITYAVNPDCPAKPTWPEHWTLEALARRREKVGEEIWARTYMQKTVTQAQATYTEEMIEKIKDPSRVVGRGTLGMDVICAVDPALDSGVCAFVAAAYDAEHLWVIDVLERTDIYRYEDIYAQVAQWSILYHPSRWIVEQNNWMKGMLQDDRLTALARKFSFSLHGHQTGRNKNDTMMGVAMMPSAIMEGELTVPWGDARSVDAVSPLLNEMRAWRPMRSGALLKQDALIALWMLWLQWTGMRANLGSAPTTLPRPSWVREGWRATG